jgi:hypothetical protein
VAQGRRGENFQVLLDLLAGFLNIRHRRGAGQRDADLQLLSSTMTGIEEASKQVEQDLEILATPPAAEPAELAMPVAAPVEAVPPAPAEGVPSSTPPSPSVPPPSPTPPPAAGS